MRLLKANSVLSGSRGTFRACMVWLLHRILIRSLVWLSVSISAFLCPLRITEAVVCAGETAIQKIFDDGRYNCFTDLTRFQGAWYCVFRSAISHGDPDSGVLGELTVIRSDNLTSWREVTRLRIPDVDLRDPKLLVLPDELRVYAVEGRKNSAGMLQYRAAAFSTVDGQKWSEPHTMCPGYIFWRPQFHNGQFYVAAYLRRPGYCSVDILTSSDGYDWSLLTTAIPPEVVDGETLWANETDLLFLPDNRALLFARRNFGGGTVNPAYKLLGGFRSGLVTASDSRRMDVWKPVNQQLFFHAPAAILHRGKIYLAGRDKVELPDGCTETCRLWSFNEEKGFTELAHFTTRGDCSYPGIVAVGDSELAVSYYSCHEGETAYFDKPGKCDIYLARIQLPQ